VIQESIRKYGENSNNRMVSNIAPETFGRFNQVITNGGRLTAAWSELNMGDVTGVLSSVRSRLLDFVLELKDQIDTAQVSVTPDAGLPERLEQAGINAGDIFKNAVFTDSTINLMIGSGVQNVNLKNKPRDIKGLLEVLREKGVPEEDLSELRASLSLLITQGCLAHAIDHVRGPEGKQERYECNRHSCFLKSKRNPA
jgi:hypothetical protein